MQLNPENNNPKRKQLLIEGLFLALVAISCVPLWVPDWLPLQDLPQHLAAIRVLHSYSAEAYGFQQWFELTPMSTQYIGFYMLASLLSFIFKVETATRIVIVVSVAAVPYAMRYLLDQLGRPMWLALFVIPLAYNTNLILGFLNFIAAIPLMLLGLGLAASFQEEMTRRRVALYILVAIVCYLMHVLPFALLMLGSVLMAMSRDRRATARALAPIAPVAVLAGLWTMLSDAGGSIRDILVNAYLRLVATPHPQASFASLDDALRQIPDWLLNIVYAPGEELVLIVLISMVCLGFVVANICKIDGIGTQQSLGSDEDDERQFIWMHVSILILVVVSWALYFLLPVGYDWVWPIAPRFVLLAAILTVPLIPGMTKPRLRTIFIVSLSLLIIGQSILITSSFKTFQDSEVDDFNQAVDAIPYNQRTAGLIFERGSKIVRFSPFLHSVALVQARKGGAVMFTFADFPQSPFRFRPDSRPERVRPRWEWTPQDVDPRNDLAWYDYVLIRGGPGKIQHQTDTYRQVYKGARWSVWQRI